MAEEAIENQGSEELQNAEEKAEARRPGPSRKIPPGCFMGYEDQRRHPV